MPSISSLGIGSGLDLNGLLDQLEAGERQRLTPIAQKRKSYEAEISAFGKLESALDKFQQASAKLGKVDAFQAVSSKVSGDALTVSAGSSAVPGSYQIEVGKLAQAHSLASNGVTEKTDSLANGAGDISITQNGEEHKISIDADSSLEDIRDAINAEGMGVTASIINTGVEGEQYRLVLTSKETGTDSEMMVSTDDAQLSDLLASNDAGTGMKVTVPAQNAELLINGIDIQSQSNRVEEAIQGVTIDLSQTTEEGSPAALTVSRDTETITEDVKAFVDAYNTLQKTMDNLTSYDSESGASGLLLGNSTMRSVESQLRNVVSSRVGEGSLSMLSDVGIELKLDGTLELDEERLDEVIGSELGSLSDFFSGGVEGDGLADRLDETLAAMIEDDGLLSSATEGLETSISALEERYARTETSINATVERYRQQFADMDMLVSQMNSTMSYLSQQFDAMNAQLGRE